MTANKAFWTGTLSSLFLGLRVFAADVTNQPPAVKIFSPPDGAVFAKSFDIPILVAAKDIDGFVQTVEFFANGNRLGAVTNPPTIRWLPLYSLTWSNVPAGDHVLTAVATDDQGASTISGPVKIKVNELHPPTVVTIFAKDPTASELSPLVAAAPDTATFVVHRSGADLDNPLTVSYRLSGTASNGVDYDKLSGEVIIPARSQTAEIVVKPIDDDLAEGTETVVLTLSQVCPPCVFADPPCLPPIPIGGCYIVGFPSEAVAFIRDNDPANQRPHVEIVKPHNGDTFPAASDIEIGVRAQDPDGWVHSVEFFANGVKVGEQSIEFIVAPPPNQVQMFSLGWSNVTSGKYILTAKATDDKDASSWSTPASIVVGEVPPLVPVIGIIASDPFASENISTNGTNTATFKIFRAGRTNLDLTVFYSVHGTASNGVDYVEIGNSVTIPAGRFSAKVVIVPIDDDLKEGIETVVLKLQPDRSLGPIARYQIGRPEKAAAIIVDNDLRRPPCLRLPDGSFHLCVEKPDGFAFRLEASGDLTAWVALCTNVVKDGALQFVDPEALEHRHRFYRIVPQSSYVPEE